MDGVGKGMLIILIILYVLSPVDLMVGPVDDLLLILFGVAAQKRVGSLE